MAKYDVYGIGNALVDMEYQVTTADLEALSITKGVMTLVDQEQQSLMMRHLAAYPHHRSSGGSAANSMIAVCQFGGTSFYSCKVASDELGHFYTSDLSAGGVDTNNQRPEREPGYTGRCVVLVTPDSDRTLCTFLGISSALSADDLVESALLDSDYFYMEGYLVTSPAARQACLTGKQLAEAAGVKTAISLSDPNMVRFFRDGLLDMIGSGVNLLFANEDEACGLAKTTDPQQAVAYLKTLSKEFVITRGPKGALIWDGRDVLSIDPIPVTAVDTVGAGDLFAGAFLYGRAQGWDHHRAGALASTAAAELVTRLGPRLPPDEAKAILQRFQ